MSVKCEVGKNLVGRVGGVVVDNVVVLREVGV